MRENFEAEKRKSEEREELLSRKNREKQMKEIEAIVEFEVRTSQIIKDGEIAEEKARQKAAAESASEKRRHHMREQQRAMAETRENLKREMEDEV